MKLIISHPTGNANVRAAANGFVNSGILAGFYTAIACFPDTLLDKLGGINALSEIRRRSFDPILKPYTHMLPLMEIGRLMSMRAGLKNWYAHETGRFCVDAAYHYLDKKVASALSKASGVSAVYAYEDGAAFAFNEAKRLGLQCLYDLPIGYWRTARKLLEKEHERWPEWASTLTGFRDSVAKLSRKDEELKLADHIFVASSFTAKTLKDYPGALAPVQVIPYGFPNAGNRKEYDRINHRPLKLLFVGGLSQRKGIADLFAAVDAIGKHVELTIVGSKVNNNCPALDAALAKHRWIPSLPHQQVLKIMREHDVLVFPSLFEGFGLVITEAMAQGTPVITTDRTAGPDIIEHGNNGWLINAGSTTELQQAIEKLLQHPDAIASAGEAAMETAKMRPWEVYGNELANAIININ